MSLAGEQVHIVPMGAEVERITEPAIKEGADRIILLEYIPPIDYPADLREQINSAFESASITVETRRVNLENLFEALNAFGSVISEHSDGKNTIFVNISSGNKIGAAAAVMACMESQSATPYYVQAESGTSMVADQQQIATGISGWDAIPLYPLERPDRQQLQIMKYIAEANTDLRDQDKPFRIKSKLVEFAEEENLPFIRGCEGDDRAKHNRLNRHIIKPLENEWGFIQVSEVGVNHRVMLTESGENTLHGFEYLLE